MTVTSGSRKADWTTREETGGAGGRVASPAESNRTQVVCSREVTTFFHLDV